MSGTARSLQRCALFLAIDQKTVSARPAGAAEARDVSERPGQLLREKRSNAASRQLVVEIVKQAGMGIRPGIVHKAACLAKTDSHGTSEGVHRTAGHCGGLYARVQVLDEHLNDDVRQGISTAIYDHYKPESMDDSVPRTIEGRCFRYRLVVIVDPVEIPWRTSSFRCSSRTCTRAYSPPTMPCSSVNSFTSSVVRSVFRQTGCLCTMPGEFPSPLLHNLPTTSWRDAAFGSFSRSSCPGLSETSRASQLQPVAQRLFLIDLPEKARIVDERQYRSFHAELFPHDLHRCSARPESGRQLATCIITRSTLMSP